MIGFVILESRDGNATFSSMEYRKYMDRGNKQDDMNIKKLFNSSRKKKTYDGYTVENVMEYLRQEGLRPEIDADDAQVVRFKYQRKNISIAIIDNFCRVSSLWRATRDETNLEAMYASTMKVMDEYRYIRVIYSGDILEFAVDQIITSLNHFKEVFNLSLDLISEAVQIHQREYNNLVGSEDTDESSPREDIYHPEFRWMPDVLFKAVSDGQLVPEALTDEDWIRKKIQSRVSSKAMHKEWDSFRINRVDNYGDYKLIVYQFPEPKVVPEAKYGAVLMNTQTLAIDYYTLEKTFNDKWVYGSMSTQQHCNFGEVDTADLDKFIEWIFTKDKQAVSGVDYTKSKQETVN
jgi:hypothetical protein